MLPQTPATQPSMSALVAIPDGPAVSIAPDVWTCDICGLEMLDLHCKLRCSNCGYVRDCSDP